ncbi:c-type cytochrome biogenesis protein CcmI [Thalassospira sp. MA62]|nr:c-type cytochrome biogenesis protein CcmI [Thalassospira sp. MA62]
MTIWIVLGAITLLVAGFILAPLVRKSPHPKSDGTDNTAAVDANSMVSASDEIARDLTVYRDQLTEIDRDIDRGVLTAEQANAARIEVQRRILNADQRIAQQSAAKDKRKDNTTIRTVSAALVVLFILGGAGMYLALGSPQLPDVPYASRADEINAMRNQQAMNEDRSNALNRAVQDLSQRLLENPDNLQGWELLGASLMALGRAEEAQTAFLEAVKRSDRDGDYLAMYAESVIRANNGQINSIARGALTEAANSDSTDPRIEYYLGMADAQQGNVEAAIDRWIALVNGAPAGATWVPMIVGRIEEAARAQGIDIEDRLDVPAPVAGQFSPDAPGPSDEDVRAAQDMTPEERQEMVMSMVNGLAARLEENPNNPEGWARLIRAYSVIGQPESAQDAYTEVTRIFADQPELLEQFAALANEIGLATTQ